MARRTTGAPKDAVQPLPNERDQTDRALDKVVDDEIRAWNQQLKRILSNRPEKLDAQA